MTAGLAFEGMESCWVWKRREFIGCFKMTTVCPSTQIWLY